MEKETKTQKFVLIAVLLLSCVLSLVLVHYTAEPAADMLLKMAAAKPSAESIRRQNAFWKGYNTGEGPEGDVYTLLGMAFRIYLISPEEKYQAITLATMMNASTLMTPKKDGATIDLEASEKTPATARIELLKKKLELQRHTNDFLERILADKERMDAALAGKEVPLLPEPTQ